MEPMYLEKNLNFHLVHHKSQRVVLESERVLAMRGTRLTSSATSPSILGTNARCQLFCILFLTSGILLSHDICSKFACRLGTIPLVRACRLFPSFYQRIFNYGCTRNAQLGATKAGFFNGLLSRYCQKKKKAHRE